MMRLVDINETRYSATILFKLLDERTPDQSISHKGMPDWSAHKAFLARSGYLGHYLIEVDGDCVGSCYVTQAGEIGISLFRYAQGEGYGPEAVRLLMQAHPRARLANVNPDNLPSRKMFEAMGGELIQVTYLLPACKRCADVSDPQMGELA